jgi:UDP-N-acetylmuramoylalanine--D-glutamate ligase
VLRQAGRAVQIGGNLGMPVLALEPLGANGIYVLEMSTFQIDLTPSWHADAAVLLNITPDHLDRHGNMANYIAVKRRIFDRRADNDIAVIGIDDAPSGAIAKELIAAGGTVLPIAIGHAAPQGVSVVEGMLYGQDRMVADISRLPALLGRHNWQNAAAAFAVARSFGVDARTIFAGLASFPGLAHRMETVGRVGGTIFVNDSKATNADAAAKALACYNSIYWIAGGRAKEGGIATLADYFPRVRHAYLIGEAAADFADTLAGKAPASISGTIERAVVQAYAQAMSDGYDNAVVLLSPACASYDQFRDFEHRGDIFRRLVAALVAGDTKAGGAAA